LYYKVDVVKKGIILMSLCLSIGLQAQNLDFGIQLGGAYYDGDLSMPQTSRNVTNLNPAIGILARVEILEGVAVRLGGLYTSVEADDSQSSLEWQSARNLNFRSKIWEGNALIELHPLKWFNSTRNTLLSPYVFGGIAYFAFNPQSYIDGEWVDLQPLGTEGQGMSGYDSHYELTSLAIPFGLGMRFQLSNNLYIDLEYGARRAETDYLDDISENYVSYGDLAEGNGGLAAKLGNKINADTGDKRGNASVADWYATPLVSLFYRFDLGGRGVMVNKKKYKTKKCPTF